MNRREYLAGATALGLIGASTANSGRKVDSGGGSGTGDATDGSSEPTANTDEDWLAQTYFVGDEAPFSTIQGAHDALGDSWTDDGRIVTLPSYDPTIEDYPIEFGKRASFHGGNYTNLQPPSGEYAIVVDIEVGKNRPPGAHFYNFSVTGGKGGIYIKNGRYTVCRDIDVNRVEEHGFATDDYNPWDDDPETDDIAINTHLFDGCVAERCGGHGFYIGQAAHGTQLFFCHAYFNGKDGIHVARNTTNAAMFGGSSEQNDRNGIRCWGCNGFGARNVYLEANDADTGGGSEVLVSGGATDSTFETCYGNGFDKTQRMFYVSTATGTDIRNCHYKQYTRSFLYIRDGALDTDVHRPSHVNRDSERISFGYDNGVRTRSDGVIYRQDLTDVAGKYSGDTGVHIDAEGNYALGVWNGREWKGVPLFSLGN